MQQIILDNGIIKYNLLVDKVNILNVAAIFQHLLGILSNLINI